jgi:hypothetical protein
MDTREQPHSPSVTIIKIITHSPSRRITVSAVEGVQLPSPFRLGSYALATYRRGSRIADLVART